jgi:hypothetical protein
MKKNELEVLAPAPVAEIASCNALHTLVTGRAAEARRIGETACHYAVLLGCKLKALKEATPHGGWLQLFSGRKLSDRAPANSARAEFGFSPDTADRYMKAASGALNTPGLAVKAQKVILALASEEEIPDTLPEAAAQALDSATKGKTLRQLYIDLGVIRAGATEKSGMGGNKRNPAAPLKPYNEEEDLWETVVLSLKPVSEMIELGDLTKLAPPRLKELEDCLRGWLDALKKIGR